MKAFGWDFTGPLSFLVTVHHVLQGGELAGRLGASSVSEGAMAVV